MSNTKFTITYNSEKLSAIQQFLPKNSQTVEERLQEQLDKMYQKYVPQPVKLYIDNNVKQ